MEFCSECNNIVLGGIGQEIVCGNCGTKNLIGKKLKNSIKHEKKKGIEILDKKKTEEKRPEVDKECPECSHSKALFFSKQTRASDEDETQFFECLKCKNKWREY